MPALGFKPGATTEQPSHRPTSPWVFQRAISILLRLGPLGSEFRGLIRSTRARPLSAGLMVTSQPITWQQARAGIKNLSGRTSSRQEERTIGLQIKLGDLQDLVPVVRGSAYISEVDAAFVKVASANTIGASICGLSEPPTTTPVQILRPGPTVKKSGRKTKVTEGVVTDVDVDIHITILFCGTAGFFNQIFVRPTGMSCPRFSDQGDSGAPVVDRNNNPVGIVISDNEIDVCFLARTTVTPIQPILDALGLSLY